MFILSPKTELYERTQRSGILEVKLSNPYKAPEYRPRDYPPQPTTPREERTPSPVWGVLTAVFIDFVGRFIAGIALCTVVEALFALWGKPRDEIGVFLASLHYGGVLYFVATATGVGVSFVAGFACVIFSKSLSLSYPILSGVASAFLISLMEHEGIARLLSPLSILLAALIVAGHIAGGKYAIRRAAISERREERIRMITCTSPTCSVKFQARRSTCPACGAARR